jgi:hypothetical protein
MAKWTDKSLWLLLALSAGTVGYSLHVRSAWKSRLMETPRPGFPRPAALDRIIPSGVYDGTCASVIDRMVTATSANVAVRWRSFACAAAPQPNDQVRATLGAVTLGDGLISLLQQNKEAPPLTYGLTWDSSGIIHFETADDAYWVTVVRLYDVNDLIENWCNEHPLENNGNSRESQQECLDRLYRIIDENVDSDTWRDNGGQIGLISEWNHILVITQTVPNHQIIDRLLRYLRSPTGTKWLAEKDTRWEQNQPATNADKRFILKDFR